MKHATTYTYNFIVVLLQQKAISALLSLRERREMERLQASDSGVGISLEESELTSEDETEASSTALIGMPEDPIPQDNSSTSTSSLEENGEEVNEENRDQNNDTPENNVENTENNKMEADEVSTGVISQISDVVTEDDDESGPSQRKKIKTEGHFETIKINFGEQGPNNETTHEVPFLEVATTCDNSKQNTGEFLQIGNSKLVQPLDCEDMQTEVLFETKKPQPSFNYEDDDNFLLVANREVKQDVITKEVKKKNILIEEIDEDNEIIKTENEETDYDMQQSEENTHQQDKVVQENTKEMKESIIIEEIDEDNKIAKMEIEENTQESDIKINETNVVEKSQGDSKEDSKNNINSDINEEHIRQKELIQEIWYGDQKDVTIDSTSDTYEAEQSIWDEVNGKEDLRNAVIRILLKERMEDKYNDKIVDEIYMSHEDILSSGAPIDMEWLKEEMEPFLRAYRTERISQNLEENLKEHNPGSLNEEDNILIVKKETGSNDETKNNQEVKENSSENNSLATGSQEETVSQGEKNLDDTIKTVGVLIGEIKTILNDKIKDFNKNIEQNSSEVKDIEGSNRVVCEISLSQRIAELKTRIPQTGDIREREINLEAKLKKFRKYFSMEKKGTEESDNVNETVLKEGQLAVTATEKGDYTHYFILRVG